MTEHSKLDGQIELVEEQGKSFLVLCEAVTAFQFIIIIFFYLMKCDLELLQSMQCLEQILEVEMEGRAGRAGFHLLQFL